MKELDIKRYNGDIPILPLTNTVEIYKYSDAILKLLKTNQNDLLYSNKKVSLPTGRAWRKHYTTQNADAANRTDDNLDDRLDIPLKFLCDLGLVNQPVKFNTEWLIAFEQDYQKLFQTKANRTHDALPTSVDAKIILTVTPHLLFKQFRLDDNYHTYLEGMMISNKVLRTGIKKTPYQKTYEQLLVCSLEQ